MPDQGFQRWEGMLLTAEAAPDPLQNQLLYALSSEDREHLLPNLHPVMFAAGQVICQPGTLISSGYFLIDSIISLLYTMETGSTAEIGLVGNDGMLGTSIFLGGESTRNSAVVAVGGQGLAIPAKLLQEEFSRRLTFRNALLRYTQALLTQVSQNAVCNSLHSIEQRLCRWLLSCQKRTNRAELIITQDLIARMLGARRESVTVAAGHLQDLGFIHYCRGRITILNQSGLERIGCECYRVVEEERDRLFGRKPVWPVRHLAEVIKEAG
jgi:CRP-like cAMP-binding protein